jgi:hypothetical protein
MARIPSLPTQLLAATTSLGLSCAATGPAVTRTHVAGDPAERPAEEPLPVLNRIDAVVSAKRRPPSAVAPVVVHGIRYSVPHFRSNNAEMKHNGGYVEATRTADGARLWLREIYRYAVAPEIEQDVQDVFIASLAVDGATLLVRDEQGASYVVPLHP